MQIFLVESVSENRRFITVISGLIIACLMAQTNGCDPNCAGTCTKFGSTKCDSVCVARFGLNINTHICDPCDPNCASTCNAKGPGKCDTSCDPGYTLKTTTYTCTGQSVGIGCGAAISWCLRGLHSFQYNSTKTKEYYDQLCAHIVVFYNCVRAVGAANVNCSSYHDRVLNLYKKSYIDYMCLPSVKQVLISYSHCIWAADIYYTCGCLRNNMTCGKMNIYAYCQFIKTKQQCGDDDAARVAATFESIYHNWTLNDTCVLDPNLYFNPGTPSSTGSTRATSYPLFTTPRTTPRTTTKTTTRKTTTRKMTLKTTTRKTTPRVGRR